jgi:hypothetical protein
MVGAYDSMTAMTAFAYAGMRAHARMPGRRNGVICCHRPSAVMAPPIAAPRPACRPPRAPLRAAEPLSGEAARGRDGVTPRASGYRPATGYLSDHRDSEQFRPAPRTGPSWCARLREDYPPTNEWGAPWTREQIRRRAGFRTVWQWGCIQPCFSWSSLCGCTFRLKFISKRLGRTKPGARVLAYARLAIQNNSGPPQGPATRSVVG